MANLIKAVVKKVYSGELNGIEKLPGRNTNGLKLIIENIKKHLAKHQFLAWLIRTIFIAITVSIVWALIHWYNDYARLMTRAKAYFAQVGVELKRRNNLIPNLIIAARKYALHEEEIFKHVSDAREMFIQAKDIKQKMQATSKLDTALSKLLAVVEQYPELKATQSVQDLIKELSNTENRVAEQKGKYNEVTRIYNQLLSTFPTNVLGRIYGFGQELSYIGIEEDILETPEVQIEWEDDYKNE